MPSDLWGPLLATDEVLAAAGAGAWVRAMLDAETALARAVADAGLAEPAAAEAVAAACVAPIEPGSLADGARAGGNPVIPLVDELRSRLPETAWPALHRGATSQDIMDSAAVLVATRTLTVIVGDLGTLGDGCAALADHHRTTLMVGRTLLQHALPLTFGLKAAGWLTGVTDTRHQLLAARDALTAQLGGAVGSSAALGRHGPAVASSFAAHLGLPDPGVPWHGARQRIAGLGAALAVAAGTAAKISGDVALLMQTEVAEAAEPGAPGRGGSSTLPHKRNPVGAAAVSSAARRAAALVPVLLGALVVEHERGVGGWQAEWEALSDLLVCAGGAVARTADTVAGLHLDPAAMAANLARTGGLILSERVAAVLVDRLGPAGGRSAVSAAVEACGSSGGTLGPALLADPAVRAVISVDELDDLLDPSGYLGATEIWIDRALTAWRTG